MTVRAQESRVRENANYRSGCTGFVYFSSKTTALPERPPAGASERASEGVDVDGDGAGAGETLLLLWSYLQKTDSLLDTP